jgi:hypothetical protein
MVALFGASTNGYAQIYYYSTTAAALLPGDTLQWDNPSSWVISSNPSGLTMPAVPTSGLNNVVVINHIIKLKHDYQAAGANGKISIGSLGALLAKSYTIKFVEQSKKAIQRLSVASGGKITAASLEFYKSDASIRSATTLSCNLLLSNQSTFAISSNVVVKGDLIVYNGNTDTTTPDIDEGLSGASLTIEGEVLSISNGPLPGLFSDAVVVCVRKGGGCGRNNLDSNLHVNPNVDIPNNGCPPPSLPVELNSFTAHYVGGKVQLSWTTALERASASFTVERSTDAHVFKPIVNIPAAGQSSTLQHYTATDAEPVSGTNYYRLRQNDVDGTHAFSPVAVVQATAIKAELLAYGQAGSAAQLVVEVHTPGECRLLRVLDNLGRVVYSEAIPAATRGNLQRRIPLGQRPMGIYTVQAITSTGLLTQRLLLQE